MKKIAIFMVARILRGARAVEAACERALINLKAEEEIERKPRYSGKEAMAAVNAWRAGLSEEELAALGDGVSLSPRRPPLTVRRNKADYMRRLSRLANRIGDRWPGDESAADAVAKQRR